METMAKYVVGDESYECVQLEGILFSVTGDGSLAIVDVAKAAVIPLDSESYFEPTTGTEEHFADVWTDRTAMLLHVSVSVSDQGRSIVAVDRCL